jgi:hypothetical protein
MTDSASIRLLIQRAAAAFALAIAAAPSLRGQTSPSPRDSASSSSPKVAVVIFAEATAGEVSFKAQPRLHVQLKGELDSIHVLDRRNLPSPVVKGTTYRDVHVAVEIFGRVNAECIARTLTGAGAAGDCASLELRGASPMTRPPGTSSSKDSTMKSTVERVPPSRN